MEKLGNVKLERGNVKNWKMKGQKRGKLVKANKRNILKWKVVKLLEIEKSYYGKNGKIEEEMKSSKMID